MVTHNVYYVKLRIMLNLTLWLRLSLLSYPLCININGSPLDACTRNGAVRMLLAEYISAI